MAYEFHKRFVDHNFNRIWNKPWQPYSYEFFRREQLLPVIRQIDVGLDLHSTSKSSPVMGIMNEKFLGDFLQFGNVEVILTWDCKNSWTLVNWMKQRDKKVFGLETGNHYQSGSYKIGLEHSLNLLRWQGMIEWKPQAMSSKLLVLEFFEEIVPYYEDFEFLKDFEGFEFLPQGTPYAKDWGKLLVAPRDVRIGLVAKKPMIGDGAGFLFVERLNV